MKIVAAALVVVAVAGVGRAEEPGVCTWGGTVAEPTGTFTITPGLRTVPASDPIAFEVVGDLAGPPARCTGTMIVRGFDIPGSRCAFGFGHATVEGVPGVQTAFTAGVLHLNHQTLFGPNGRIVGAADVEVASTGLAEARAGCESEAGVTSGRFSGIVTFLPVGI